MFRYDTLLKANDKSADHFSQMRGCFSLDAFWGFKMILFKSGGVEVSTRPPDKSVLLKFIFLFLNQDICCGCSKEPSQWDGSFYHPKTHVKTDR